MLSRETTYPQEFIDKCKKVYPDWTDLHTKLTEGWTFVGRYLDDARCGSISTKKILAATSLEELKEEARHCLESEHLYAEWCDIYEAQHGKRNS